MHRIVVHECSANILISGHQQRTSYQATVRSLLLLRIWIDRSHNKGKLKLARHQSVRKVHNHFLHKANMLLTASFTALVFAAITAPTFAQYHVVQDAAPHIADVPDTGGVVSGGVRGSVDKGGTDLIEISENVSPPGAMDDDGDFYVFKRIKEIWRWDNSGNVWVKEGSHNFDIVLSPPSARTIYGGFHFTGFTLRVSSPGKLRVSLVGIPTVGLSPLRHPTEREFIHPAKSCTETVCTW